MLHLNPRDTPTTFVPLFAAGFPADLVPPVQAAFFTASSHLDVPGVEEYPVAVQYDPRTPVLGYGTYWPGEGRGAIWLGPAVRAYDAESVALHEVGHAAGMLDHSDDPADVMFHGLWPEARKRQYAAGDDELFRSAGLLTQGVPGDDRVPPDQLDGTPTPSPDDPAAPTAGEGEGWYISASGDSSYAEASSRGSGGDGEFESPGGVYTEADPYTGTLVGVPFGLYGGWALVPPGVAAGWGIVV